MKNVNMILGEKIRQGRKANNLTREKLAENIGVSPRFLAEVESGKVGVSLQTLKNLSVALSTSTDYLLGLDNQNQLNQFETLCSQLTNVDEKYYSLIASIIKELKNIN